MAEHNSQLAISHLPTEIFTEIFTYSMDCESDSHPNSILLLTHVCRQWRDIVLNCPLFWSCPDFSRPRLAREMVQRSKPGPLDVRLDQIMPGYSVKSRGVFSEVLSIVAEALVAETPRIQTLNLRSEPFRFDLPFDTCKSLLSFTHPMPLLQSLSIRPSYDEAKLELPAHILAGGSPFLEKLELYQCKIPWRSSIFANLITLDLGGVMLPASDPPNASEFLQTLGGTPLLEHLLLTDVFPLSIATDVEPAVVALPHLQELYLEVRNPAQTHSCIETFHRLSFPQTANVRLYISYDETAFLSPPSSPLFRRFFKKMTSLGEVKILGLCVGSLHDNNLGLEIWYNAIPFDPNNDMFSFRFATTVPSWAVDIEWHGTTHRYAPNKTMVQEMVRSFPMQHLETVDLRQFTEDEGLAKTILDSLISLTTLRCLLISKKNIRAFISCITAAKSLPFPALRDLGLFDVDLGQLIREGRFSSLVSALEARPEKLERLMIDEHYLLKPEFKRLRAVAVVTVSNMMQGSNSDSESDGSGSREDESEDGSRGELEGEDEED